MIKQQNKTGNYRKLLQVWVGLITLNVNLEKNRYSD